MLTREVDANLCQQHSPKVLSEVPMGLSSKRNPKVLDDRREEREECARHSFPLHHQAAVGMTAQVGFRFPTAERIPAVAGRRRGLPWTSHQVIAGPTRRDTQRFTPALAIKLACSPLECGNMETAHRKAWVGRKPTTFFLLLVSATMPPLQKKKFRADPIKNLYLVDFNMFFM